jgi:transposase
VNRQQLQMRPVDVEKLVGEDHPVRAIWELVGQLDLRSYYEEVQAVEGKAGRDAYDARLLISLWIYACSQGVGSGRELSRLCGYHPAYQWLTGMEVVNYHTLCDFRVKHDKGLKEIFTQILGVLSAEELITLERVTHDGTRIKANASSKSFRREKRIRAHLKAAREQVERMGDPRSEDVSARVEKARQRAARERKERLEKAAKELKEIQAGKTEEEKDEARVSMTDPQARVMKQSNGGWAPSYNVQITTDAKNTLIVGVRVSQSGSDNGELASGIETVEGNMKQRPSQVVVDGGYLSRENIVAMAERGIDLIAPLAEENDRSRSRLKALGITPDFYAGAFKYNATEDYYTCPMGKTLRFVHKSKLVGRTNYRYEAETTDCQSCHAKKECSPQSKKGRTIIRGVDEPLVASFYQKMETEEAKAISKQRGQVAEFPNAWIKEKIGLRQFRLRGRVKTEMEARWACLTYNIQQWIRLCWLPRLADGLVR